MAPELCRFLDAGPPPVVFTLGSAAVVGGEEFYAESVEAAMTPGPSTIRPSARVEAMVERMGKQNLSSLPVTTSDGRLVGMFLLQDAERESDR